MDNVVDYIDDPRVHTRTWEEHVQTLKELFKRLKAANLVARPTRCVFGATQMNFFGSLCGTGYDWVARCQCPEDEGRT